jgi:hypothetical protein
VEIVEAKIKLTQNLSGIARPMALSEPGVKGVLVEDCSSDWKRVISSTHTDFPDANREKLHYLRFSMDGINTSLIKAKISKTGDKELSIILNIAT